MRDTQKCWKCGGCGKVADTEEQEAWRFWEELPPGSDLAVRLGVVQPMTCPECEGKGEQ